MKNIYISLVAILMVGKLYAQDCFNEFNNAVTASACLNHRGFDLMELYARYKNPSQETFVNTENGNNVGHIVKSFDIVEHSGKFYNIHQYGFIVKEDTICISYKIIEHYKYADVAIMINQLPVFNRVVKIDKGSTSTMNFIVDKLKLADSYFNFGLVLDESALKHITLANINLTVAKR